MSKNLLITLLPSSGVDLGRWLLAHYKVDYTERPHAPIFHVLALKSWGVGAEEYPLFVQDGEKYKGNDFTQPMLEAKAPPELKLIPNDPAAAKEVDELQHYARFTVGGAVVNWSYWNLLKYKSVVWPSLTTQVPWYEKLVWFVLYPIMRGLMYKGLKLDQSVADEGLKTIYAGFDKFDAMLADGRPYLTGDKLTYADLAMSACLGPMILAQGYHGMLPNHAKCPVFMQKIYAELRARPTGLHIQKMYDLHRPAALLQV